MTEDEKYMHRCLQLASAGSGHTLANPMVGCVIVNKGRIIGEGFHRKFGEPHAEVNAVRAVADQSLIEGATVYVSLEPCSHFRKTPPCVDLLVSLRPSRVVVATADPNPEVSGRGIATLRKAGIEVTTGVLQAGARDQNRRFFTFHTRSRPYVILKWAQTADGFMDKLRKKNETGINWITAPAIQKLVHKWRSQEQAILVGSKTVINDNPALTVRKVAGRNPIRIILDPNSRIPESHQVFNRDNNYLVFVNEYSHSRPGEVKIDPARELISQVLDELYRRSIQSVLVEGGAFTLQQFLEQNLWDEARVLCGRPYFGAGLKAPEIKQTPLVEYSYGVDRVRIYRNL